MYFGGSFLIPQTYRVNWPKARWKIKFKKIRNFHPKKILFFFLWRILLIVPLQDRYPFGMSQNINSWLRYSIVQFTWLTGKNEILITDYSFFSHYIILSWPEHTYFKQLLKYLFWCMILYLKLWNIFGLGQNGFSVWKLCKLNGSKDTMVGSIFGNSYKYTNISIICYKHWKKNFGSISHLY